MTAALVAMPIGAHANPEPKAALASQFAAALTTSDARKVKGPSAVDVGKVRPADDAGPKPADVQTPKLADVQLVKAPEVNLVAKGGEMHHADVRPAAAPDGVTSFAAVVRPEHVAGAVDPGFSSHPDLSTVRMSKLVSFDPGRLRLHSASREKLQALAASWKTNTVWATITVDGYPDAKGRSEADSLALAKQRAELVRGYLVRYGVPAEFVVAVGHAAVGEQVTQIDLSIAACGGTTTHCRP